MKITPPDIIIFAILGFFSISGLRRGFIEEIGRLVSFSASFISASKFHHLAFPFLENYIDDHILVISTSYLLVFIIIFIVITTVIKIVQKFVEFVLLGWLNRLLGLLLGLLKGFLIISLLLFVIESIPIKIDNEDNIREKLKKESVMYQICNHVKELIILTIPADKKITLKNNNFDI